MTACGAKQTQGSGYLAIFGIQYVITAKYAIMRDIGVFWSITSNLSRLMRRCYGSKHVQLRFSCRLHVYAPYPKRLGSGNASGKFSNHNVSEISPNVPLGAHVISRLPCMCFPNEFRAVAIQNFPQRRSGIMSVKLSVFKESQVWFQMSIKLIGRQLVFHFLLFQIHGLLKNQCLKLHRINPQISQKCNILQKTSARNFQTGHDIILNSGGSRFDLFAHEKVFHYSTNFWIYRQVNKKTFFVHFLGFHGVPL